MSIMIFLNSWYTWMSAKCTISKVLGIKTYKIWPEAEKNWLILSKKKPFILLKNISGLSKLFPSW